MKKMKKGSRILIAIASLALIATYFIPVWFIFLIAPQYPEGLTMNIWLDKITGEVDIINGLNHYIGMKHISIEMFPEFKYLVYIVGFYILFGLTVAITGKRKLLFAYLVLTVLGGVAALVDFYMWGYDYGHNLDPKAAIKVPGLSYQPPVVGHKTLLNFDAYSLPDKGGWVVICVSITFFLVWLYEYWWLKRKTKTVTKSKTKKQVTTVAALGLLLFSSCSSKPEPINFGKDQCDDCRMTIVDTHFGAEILTKKGRVYKFDDVRCIANYINTGRISKNEIGSVLFIDYNNSKDFVSSKTAVFVVSDALKSPMGSNAAAFTSGQAAKENANTNSGKVTTWENLLNAR
jgi:copper chaperone NosL